MQPAPDEIVRHEEWVAKFLSANMAAVPGMAERTNGLFLSEKMLLFLGIEVQINSTIRANAARLAMRLWELRDRINFQVTLEERGLSKPPATS